jgi:succinate dehydrogenase / fumarate reductase, iron-sulfur subunit
MVAQHDAEGFGACTLHGECQAACPKEISIESISRMHRDYLHAVLASSDDGGGGGEA